MWRETTKHERNMVIFREELDAFLPEKILDFHVHILNEGVLPAGREHSCAGHPVTRYGFDDLARDLAETYPGRETFAVCMGFPAPEYDRGRNNRYVAQHCDGERFFSLRLYDPHEADASKIRDEIVENLFVGLKPYHSYVRRADPEDIEVRDMLPPGIMQIADDLGLIVLLHIPRKGRLADPLNRKQVAELCETYPRAKIVLAHIGRAYFLKNVVGHLDEIKGLPNLYFDIAMLNNWEVLEYLFRTVPPEKVLFATDIPIALAPGKSVEMNDQYTYITPVPWKLSISDDHRKLVFTSFLYEELRAVKKAVERLRLSDDFVRGLFCENGMRLLAAARPGS